MPISIKYFGNYNPYGPVTLKYNPLEDLKEKTYNDLNTQDIQDIVDLIKSRYDTVRHFSFLENGWGFNFYLPTSLNNVRSNENVCNEFPIAVLSSGRSAGIKEALDNTSTITNIKDVDDPAAYQNGVSVFYDPARVNAPATNQRYVYILVNIIEYATYAENLKDYILSKKNPQSRLILVGWGLGARTAVTGLLIKPTIAQNFPLPLGFGVTRMTVIFFFKELFKSSGAIPAKANQRVFLCDDDVTFINGFPGFTELEGELIKQQKTTKMWSIGLKGDTKREPLDEIKKIANGHSKITNIELIHGFLQQAVLWDLGQMAQFNFSPTFVSGKEDSSLDSFVGQEATSNHTLSDYKAMVKSTKIIKASLTVDDPKPQILYDCKNALLYVLEANTTLNVEHSETGLASPCDIKTFIKKVLPSGYSYEDALSKAVDQIVDGLVKYKFKMLPPYLFDMKADGSSTEILFNEAKTK